MNTENNGFRLTSSAVALMFVFGADASAGSMGNGPELWSGMYYGIDVGGGKGTAHTAYSKSNEVKFSAEGGLSSIPSVPGFPSLPGVPDIPDIPVIPGFPLNPLMQPLLMLPLPTSVTQSQIGNGPLSGDASGSLGNLFLGYNFHPTDSKYLWGAQLEGTIFSDISVNTSGVNNFKDTVSVDGIISTAVPGQEFVSIHTDLKNMFSLLGRAGVLVRPDTLVYGLAGPTDARFVTTDDTLAITKQWQLGVTAGAGVEHKFNQHWSVLAEYRYVHFNIDTSTGSSFSSTQGVPPLEVVTSASFNTSTNTSFGLNLGKVGIVFRA